MPEARKPISVIAEVLGKTQNSIKQKMLKMGLLELEQVKKSICSSSSDLKLPKKYVCQKDSLIFLRNRSCLLD
jgi:hypothetical protein